MIGLGWIMMYNSMVEKRIDDNLTNFLVQYNRIKII